jgi:hypothetical protein
MVAMTPRPAELPIENKELSVEGLPATAFKLLTIKQLLACSVFGPLWRPFAE